MYVRGDKITLVGAKHCVELGHDMLCTVLFQDVLYGTLQERMERVARNACAAIVQKPDIVRNFGLYLYYRCKDDAGLRPEPGHVLARLKQFGAGKEMLAARLDSDTMTICVDQGDCAARVWFLPETDSGMDAMSDLLDDAKHLWARADKPGTQ